jgi:zinc protease
VTDAFRFPISPDSVHRRTLSNGLKVLVRRDASAPVVAIVTYVSAGYFDEADEVSGIAHVLEHMYFKGTPGRGVGEIAKQTKAVGGYLNAGTIYDHTSYYTVLPSSGFTHGLDIQADAYANSLIDAEELRRELEVIIEEAKRKADNPGAVATETLYELLHDTHRMRRWRIGREEGLRALTRDALMTFYRNYYHPGNTVLSIVGDVDPDAVFAEVERRYGALASGAPDRLPAPHETAPDEFRYRDMHGDIAQTQLAIGWRTPDASHPDTPLLDVAAMALGTGRASRLYRAVRERQLASSVSAYNYTPTQLGVFVLRAETPPKTTLDAARAMWDQVRRLRDGDVGDLELERAKRIAESQWLRRLEDMEGQANYLAEWEAFGDWRLGERYLERMVTATSADVTRAAAQWLEPDRAGVLVYRPSAGPAIAASSSELRGALDRDRPTNVDVTPVYAAKASAAVVVRPSAERVEAGVHVFRTSRGVPVLVRSKPGSPLVHLGFFALAGAFEEPESLAGLTTLMARTAAKGTARRTAAQIAEEAELLGGSIGSSTGADSLGWSISVPQARGAAATALLADVVQHATFADDVLETERAIAIADVISVRDDMYRFPMRLATQAAFKGHPYSVPASGTEESLARISAADVSDWHRRSTLRAPAVIGVVGDGEATDLAALVIRAFDEIELRDAPLLPAFTWPPDARVSAESRDRAQTALAMLFPGPSRGDDDRFAASMIAGVASGLGGRFFDELRDKQSLSYTVQAFPSMRRAAGTFVAYMATSPDKESAARDGLLREFEKLRTEPVTAEELDRAKTYAIGTHQIRMQSGGAWLGDMVDAWLLGSLGELTEYESRLRAVTAARMLEVAQRYFDPSRRVEGIVRGR